MVGFFESFLSKPKRQVLVFGSLLFTIVALLLTASILPNALQSQVEPMIDSMVRIDADAQASNTDLFEAWVNGESQSAPVVTSSAYLWHVTNPIDVLAGQKPMLQQKGPFTSRKIEYKRNIVFSRQQDGLAIATYETRSTWSVVESAELDAEITTWSPMFMALRDGPLNIAYLGAPWTDDTRLFKTATAREFLVGFSDPLLDYLRTLAPFLPAKWAGPWTNETTWSKVTIFIGEPDKDPWNRRNRVSAPILDPQLDGTMKARWGSAHSLANIMTGTDGMMFARPLASRPSPVYVWSGEVGRAIQFVPTILVDLNGVTLRRFSPNSNWLLNVSSLMENADFYQFGPSGLANLTSMVGAQVFVSTPHFLNGDLSLLNGVDGLSPDASLHDTYLDIEPKTGATLRAQKALQVAYQLRRSNVSNEIWFSLLGSNIRYVPSYWISETAQATSADTNKLKDGFTKIASIQILYYILMAGGLAFAACSSAFKTFVYRMSFKTRYQVKKIEPSNENTKGYNDQDQKNQVWTVNV